MPIELRPSAAHRWVHCAGSAQLTADIEAPPSPYADAGITAHSDIKACLLGDLEVTPQTVSPGIEIDAIDLSVEIVRADHEAGDVLLIEHEVDLGWLNPPIPISGTADAIRYRPGSRHLAIYDHKYGAGVPVEVGGNLQLTAYAAGACADPAIGPVATIEFVIIQARAPHPAGPVRRETFDAFELIERSADLMAAARRALEPDAELNPGSWCKFCAAAPSCPALRAHALEVAQIEFAAEITTLPPAPARLEADEIGQLLDAADLIEHWIRSLRAHAHSALERGFEIPGWKLVRKRAMRRWRDEDQTAPQLEALGLSPDYIFTRALRSPAQIEKILGRKRRDEITDLVIAESSGSTLAPDADHRPALEPAGFFGLLDDNPQSRETANTEKPAWQAS
jgi:hypothetical protein